MDNIFIILSIMAFSLQWATASIRCYTCVSTNTELTCVNDPDNVLTGSPITNCQHAECCTIYRQEYRESPGIISFSRSCQPNCPKDGFYKEEDAHFKTYQTYCSTPVCNTGKGASRIDGGGHGSDDEGGSIYGVHGRDDARPNMASLLLSLGLPVLVIFLRG